jgi:hypothetical protein
MTFLIQVDEDLVQLSAAGLFKIGIHLVPAVNLFSAFILSVDDIYFSFIIISNLIKVGRCYSDVHGHSPSKLI